jgi:hypothetical protein
LPAGPSAADSGEEKIWKGKREGVCHGGRLLLRRSVPAPTPAGEHCSPLDKTKALGVKAHARGGPRPLIRELPPANSSLVDPASSHMLVSKIKPCMSKYKQSIQ